MSTVSFTSPFHTSAVSLSALLYSCPLIFDNTACFFTKKISAFRKTLPQLHFLSICHLLTYLQLSSFFLPPSQTFLFSYFSSSSHTSMPLHTGFPLKWKPLFHCCHPSCESFLITLRVEPAPSVLSNYCIHFSIFKN